ncbi:unnamed protein product [Diplocarpon coronariae]
MLRRFGRPAWAGGGAGRRETGPNACEYEEWTYRGKRRPRLD